MQPQSFPAPQLALAIAIALAALALAGCTPPPTRISYGDREQILFRGNGAEPQDVDPQTVTGVPEDHIITALFEGLVSEDPHDLHPVPGVAESWDISVDGTMYTFHLRKTARWSNGEPLTARDFIRSYRRMLMPSLAAEYAYMLYVVTNAERFNTGKIGDFSKVGFKALDDFTLQVQLTAPGSYFLSLLNHYSWFPARGAAHSTRAVRMRLKGALKRCRRLKPHGQTTKPPASGWRT
jgi:oligopeptide transport system substrate-binding protein